MSQPLHYRPLRCERTTGCTRLWPLARQEALTIFRTKWGVALYLFCLMPGIGRLIMLMIMFGVIQFGPMPRRLAGNIPAGMRHLDPTDASFYLHSTLEVMPGMVFFMLLTTMIVARSVARDRATNALELYWTRGISPWGYLFAKWWGGYLITATMTVALPLLLWISACLLADDWTLFQQTFAQFFVGLGAIAAVTGLWTLIGTFVSASAASANAAMVIWCVLLVGTRALGGILAGILREPELRSALSFWEAGGVIVRSIADLPQQRTWLGGAVVTMLAVFLTTLLLARRRMQVQEALQ